MSAPPFEDREVREFFSHMTGPQKSRALSQYLLQAGFIVQRQAQQREIIRGGKQPPAPDRLTSRTGTGRRSIVVDRRFLPRAIEVGPKGPGAVYMNLHEFGGTVRRTRRAPGSGRATASTARYPARPFMRPAYDHTYPQLQRRLLQTVGRLMREA